MKSYSVKVENMTCAHCKEKIEKRAKENGATNVNVNREAGLLTFDAEEGAAEKVISSINETGIYKATKI